jgi:NAD(P)-dependent dehydrogenase (short-subunit alcohol dehydrogenase family)
MGATSTGRGDGGKGAAMGDLLESLSAIVTGAASLRGLGSARASLLAEHGACVLITDLDAAMAQAAARELGSDNIRVNAICAGFIDTDITAGLMTPDKLQAIIASVPMGRPGHAHEVAGCALFLASELASYVTGSEIDINGGSHIH